MASSLTITREDLDGDVVLLNLVGSLDSHTYDDLETEINTCFDENRFKVIVNMLQIDYISSAGVGVFVGAVGQAQDAGGNIVLLKTTDKVKEIFDLLGLSRILNFADELATAKSFF